MKYKNYSFIDEASELFNVLILVDKNVLAIKFTSIKEG